MVGTSSTSLRSARLGAPFTSKGLWDFIAERHRIFIRRQEGQPAPWTDDPILQRYRFCNVYRELDRGTKWYLTNLVIPNEPILDFVDLLWRTIVYRLVNSISIFEQLGGVAGYQHWRDMITEMLRRQMKLHSYAYQTLPRPAGAIPRAQRLEFVLTRLDSNIKGLTWEILHAQTLEEVSQHLKSQYGIGPFVAMQVYRDLILAQLLPFPQEDWVEVGPGAAWTLIRMYGVGATKGTFLGVNSPGKQELWQGKIEKLCEGQQEFASNLYHRAFTPCDIEHCLCEAGKYQKIRMWLDGEGPCPKLRYRGNRPEDRHLIEEEWRNYRACL